MKNYKKLAEYRLKQLMLSLNKRKKDYYGEKLWKKYKKWTAK